MERLTERELDAYGDACYCKCHSNDCDYECDVCNILSEGANKLKAYEDAEEQGILIRLPCKYAYFLVDVNSKWGGMVMKKPIKELTLYEMEQIDKRKYYSTREEAEAALAETEE